MDMRAYGKDFESYYERAKNETRYQYIRSIPSGIEDWSRAKLVINVGHARRRSKKRNISIWLFYQLD